MDGLKQVEVVAEALGGLSEILGLRGDGALFRGLVTIDQITGKATVVWIQFTEDVKKG
jgi:hypothetical protein